MEEGSKEGQSAANVRSGGRVVPQTGRGIKSPAKGGYEEANKVSHKRSCGSDVAEAGGDVT